MTPFTSNDLHDHVLPDFDTLFADDNEFREFISRDEEWMEYVDPAEDFSEEREQALLDRLVREYYAKLMNEAYEELDISDCL